MPPRAAGGLCPHAACQESWKCNVPHDLRNLVTLGTEWAVRTPSERCRPRHRKFHMKPNGFLSGDIERRTECRKVQLRQFLVELSGNM